MNEDFEIVREECPMDGCSILTYPVYRLKITVGRETYYSPYFFTDLNDQSATWTMLKTWRATLFRIANFIPPPLPQQFFTRTVPKFDTYLQACGQVPPPQESNFDNNGFYRQRAPYDPYLNGLYGIPLQQAAETFQKIAAPAPAPKPEPPKPKPGRKFDLDL